MHRSIDLGLYLILVGTGLLMAACAVVGNTFVGRRIATVLDTHPEPDLMGRAWNSVRRMGLSVVVSGVLLTIVLTYGYATSMSTSDAMWLFAALMAVPVLFFPTVTYRIAKVAAAVTP